MNKGFKLLFICLFVSALFANTNAVAGNWNSSSVASGIEHGNKSSYQIIEFKGQIPLMQRHSLSPTQSNLLITNTKKFDYPNCSGSIKNNYRKYPFDFSTVRTKFSLLAAKDINDVIDFSDGDGDDKGLSDKFSMTIHKAHMSCLSGNFVAAVSLL